MPLFMDIHQKLPAEADSTALAAAHRADLQAQGRYGTNYVGYWFAPAARKAFCLVEAPDAASAAQVHREAHGMVADEVYGVERGPASEHPEDATAPDAPGTLVAQFLRALMERDFTVVKTLLAPDVRFRALVPSGFREAGDAEGATTWLRTWFGSSKDLDVLEYGHELVAGRHHIWYRFALEREGRASVIHQDGFCDVAGGRITDVSLLCSGFRPAESPRSDR